MKKHILLLIVSLLIIAGKVAGQCNVIINNPAAVCSPSTVDLTVAAVTSGSDAGLTFTYWIDSGAITALSNPNAVATSGTYYIKGDNGSGCTQVKPVSVTVNPVSVGGTLGGTTSVCTGTNSTVLTLTGYTGSITKWQSSVDNWTTPVDISNTNTTYTATNLIQTTKYRVVVTSGVCSSATSGDATITVDLAAVGGTLSGDATVCSGTNSTGLTLTGYTGTISKWQSSTNNWASSTDIINTTATYTATNLAATTRYRVVVTNGACTSNSGVSTVTVDPVSVGGSLGGTTSVCTGTNSTVLTLTGYTGIITKWQSSVDNWTTPVDISNTNTTYTATNLTQTTKYRVVVTNGVCSSATSSDATITVDAAAVGGALSGDATVCSGTNSTVLSLTGHTGTISKWQSSTNNWASSTDIINTTATYTATNLATTTKYRVVVTNGACTSNSGVATVTVDPVSVGGSLGGTTAVCTGTNSTVLTLTGYTGIITKWQSSVDNWTTPVDISNTNTTYTATNLTQTTKYRVVVTNGVCSSANSGDAILTVQPNNAANVAFTGSLTVGSVLTVTYDFNSTSCFPDDRSQTKYYWYRSTHDDHSPSSNYATVTGDPTYKLTNNESGNYIQVRVTIWNGSGYQTEVVSSWTVGKVAANSKPVASSIAITGTALVGQSLTGSYSYTDIENDPQGTSVFQWVSADNDDGTGNPANIGSSSLTYTLTNAETGKYIGLKVTPKATTGTTTGDQVTMASPWFGSVVANAPVASNVKIIGEPKSGTTVYGYYLYSDVENDPESGSTYQWYYADNSLGTIGKNAISGAASVTYKIADTYIGKFIGFSVVPKAGSGVSPGSMVTTATFIGSVTNSVPAVSNVAITGPGTFNVNNILSGSYDYTDPEGDVEGNSKFEWLRNSTNSISGATIITGATNISYQLALSDTGKYIFFRVTPKAQTGNLSYGTALGSSATTSKVNTPPYAVIQPITYPTTVAVGQVLTGHYVYHDGDLNPQGTSTFRWFRNGTPIPDATSITYTIDLDDEGNSISFEVTPVSSAGFPNTGNPVTSVAVGPVPSSGAVPVASEVCIQGTRVAGQTLSGKYRYTFGKAEGVSTYRWLIGTDSASASPITGAESITYLLQGTDVSGGQNIYFEVTPKSVSPVKTGVAVKSTRIARITIPQDHYTELVDTVKLTVVPAGGSFSGPGVTNGIFSPKKVGQSASPYPVRYLYNIVNSTTTCAQEDIKDIYVTASTTAFGSVKSVYCKDDDQDVITVEAMPNGAYPYTYYGYFINSVYNKVGIVSENLLPNPYTTGSPSWSVTIDPKLINVGVNYLYLYYNYLGYWYLLRTAINVEQVGTITEISNLNDAYCAADDIQNITVYGLYPAGGTATWTGALLTDKNQLTSKLNPGSVTPGVTYPITYNYRTTNGCYSNTLTRNVTINPMPDANFDLPVYCNIEGGEIDLIPDVAPGTGYTADFLGAGVSGTKFYPDISGVRTVPIEYRVKTDKDCFKSLTHYIEVDRAVGTFNNIPSKICYSSATYNLFMSNLPSDAYGYTTLNFKNKKNSLTWTPYAVNAQYNVAAAHAGYDTIYFSYRRRGVDFTLSKPVFIDSIGNILITGIKDNYCDYESNTTLNALVENSTGNGSYSFSGTPAAFTNYNLYAIFRPSVAPPSAISYSVSYTHTSNVNESGCTKTVTLPVTVNKSPDVSIFNDRVTVNIKEEPLILSGLPTDGTFTGKGVYKSGNDFVFDPVVAGLGDIEFTLSYTDSKGCSATKKDTLTVAAASGSILGLNSNNQYCYDGLKDTLTYTSSKPWSNGAFSGAGITNTSSAKAVFNPAAAGKGDHDIVFTYTDAFGTIFDISATVNVDSLGVVEIKPLTAGDEYCTNDTPFELITTPRGGTFTGPVTTGYLIPAKAIGDTAVTYTYLNIRTGCSITGRVPFRIYPAPVVAFAPSDICIENDLDSIRFINNTTSADEVKNWVWTFSDLGGTDLSSKETPAYIFKSGGQHLITLTATTINGCTVKKDLTVDLGVKPVADFFWRNECFVPNDSISLHDTTFSTSTIISRTWNFFDGGPLRTGTKIKYPKNRVGPIAVQYIVQTPYANCSDTVNKNIYVRPNIILTADGYFENFESGNGGWSKGDENPNSWSFGTPDRTIIKSASSGSAAWFTRFDVANQQIESSSIISPCFDFTKIMRPMIGLGLWRNFDKDRDGAVLQYKIGDIGTWQNVGSIDDGINWYNSTLIKGHPGGDQMIGWTAEGTPDTKWIEAKHSLELLKGKKDVKFRIAYGSDGNSQNNDGVAFDDIFIGERKRNVLLEHFTNNSSLASSQATKMINEIDSLNDNDIINIQYHTNFPGVDSFYINNPGDASARILFYGLTKAPYTFVDGGTKKENAVIYDYSGKETDNSLTRISSTEILRRVLRNPVFDIKLDSLIVSGGVLTIGGEVTALKDTTFSNLTLYLAVIEKTNRRYNGAAGEALFHNVFRKFIPDAAGINLAKTWTKGTAVPIQDQTWIIQKTLNSSDIEVVAFIQNSVTKEVYQAQSMLKPKITVGIENPGTLNHIDFALYPNPARHQLTIRFGDMLDADTDIFIYDFGGAVVKTFKAGSGETEFTIDDLGLKDGIYLIRVSSKGVNLGFRKLIISGS